MQQSAALGLAKLQFPGETAQSLQNGLLKERRNGVLYGRVGEPSCPKDLPIPDSTKQGSHVHTMPDANQGHLTLVYHQGLVRATR